MHYLIEACHHLQRRGINFVCRIVGHGPDRPLVEEMIQRYNLDSRVELLGVRQHDAIQRIGELPRSERLRMGYAARAIVECFAAPRGAARMLELIQSVAPERFPLAKVEVGVDVKPGR